LDGVVKLPGSPANLVVKFAESEKMRSQKAQTQFSQLNPLMGLGVGANALFSQPAYWQLAQQQLLQQQLAQQQLAQQQLSQGGMAAYANFFNNQAGTSSPSGQDAQNAANAALYGNAAQLYGNNTGAAQLYGNNAASLYGNNATAAAAAAQLYGNNAALYGLAGLASPAQTLTTPSMALGSNKEGPPGANLFVYHLPREYTDADLMSLFSPFGGIVSCKVVTEKQTGESKGFGFVSYETADSATLAIGQMNGFQVAGGRRLKVEVKTTSRGATPGGGGGFRPY